MTTAISWLPKPFVVDPPSPSENDAVHEVANAVGDEVEDITMIRPTDSVIVTARSVNDEHGLIEVWTFEDREYEDRKIHHDIRIKASPLCADHQKGERNFLAVGTTDTSIGIWDLNDIKVVEPRILLGGTDGHTESVLGLAWDNKRFSNNLASVSADNRVKIWDVVTGDCDITMAHHSDKVQAVAWKNDIAPWVLLSGSLDRTVAAKDLRTPSQSGYTWPVTAGVKSLAWDPLGSFFFVASLEDGTVECFDARVYPASAFTIHAHTEAVTSVSFNLLKRRLFATGSLDQTVKLWDLSNSLPTCVASKNPRVGDIFSISFSEDDPFMLAIGGKIGKLNIWDTSDSGIS